MHSLKVLLDDGAFVPTRAHPEDAGLDLYSPDTVVVPAARIRVCCGAFPPEREVFIEEGSAIIDTGVHVAIPAGYVGFLKSKSGLNVKNGITGEGVIDAGYTGSIVVKLYNSSGSDYKVERGHKISQLVILPIATPEVELVESLEETERGNGGFGSTGR